MFFNEDWVAYDDRQNYLLEADVGVSTHLDHVETEFSFRTRILDYLWAVAARWWPRAATRSRDLIEAAASGSPSRPTTSTRWRRRCSSCSPTPTPSRACRRAAPSSPTSSAGRACSSPSSVLPVAPAAPDLVLPEMAELVGTGRSQVTRPLRMVHWHEDVRTFAGHLKRGELKTMVRKAASRVRMVVARSWSRS